MEFYDLVEQVVHRSLIGDHRLKRATENAFVESNMASNPIRTQGIGEVKNLVRNLPIFTAPSPIASISSF